MTTQDNLLFLIETGKPLEIKRAMAVRMSIQGYGRAEIAETLGVSIPFIDKCGSGAYRMIFVFGSRVLS